MNLIKVILAVHLSNDEGRVSFKLRANEVRNNLATGRGTHELFTTTRTPNIRFILNR